MSIAASEGYLDIVKLLISLGADIDVMDKFSQTPLHGALENGDIRVVNALIEAGASINKSNMVISTYTTNH